MRIGVIGHHGVVGSAIRHGFERLGHHVVGVDPKAPSTSLADVRGTDITFICVPTPQRSDGSCDTSIVEETVHQLAEYRYGGIVAIKSTITPGTSAALAAAYGHLNITFVPEFLRERCAFSDFYEHHDLLVIGIGPGGLGAAAAEAITDAHGHLPKQVAVMSRTEAELCKYFSNLFNALRIVFANEFAEVATVLGCDYAKIKRAMVARPGIPDAYLDVSDTFKGFAGVCLPKDTAAFAHLARKLCPHLALFETIVEDNKKFTASVPPGMRA